MTESKMSENKIALVTGGTRGIGLAISKALIADGYKVAAVYASNTKAAEDFEKDMKGKGRTFKCNVADLKAVQKTCTLIEKEMGPVSVLINNAGITRDGVLHKMEEDDWHDVINTNLTSCFTLCRVLLPGMRDRKFGRIVNISSINGQKGQFGQANYAAAKAGILGFTKALALENAAKGITVNTVCPGYVETDMTASVPSEVLESIVKSIPAGRMGRPDDIAATVAFLVSDKAGFITGSTVTANGGQYMV